MVRAVCLGPHCRCLKCSDRRIQEATLSCHMQHGKDCWVQGIMEGSQSMAATSQTNTALGPRCTSLCLGQSSSGPLRNAHDQHGAGQCAGLYEVCCAQNTLFAPPAMPETARSGGKRRKAAENGGKRRKAAKNTHPQNRTKTHPKTAKTHPQNSPGGQGQVHT